MISRIRLDAFGNTPGDVSDTLYPHADEIEKMLGVGVSRGEFVVERCLEEPEDSVFAFKGRLLLHPEIGRTGGSFTVTSPAPGVFTESRTA